MRNVMVNEERNQDFVGLCCDVICCCGCYRVLFFSKALNFHECFSLNIGLIGVTYLILLSLKLSNQAPCVLKSA